MAGDKQETSADVDIVAALVECEEQVDQLKRENKLLRDASGTFGALAERLNATLESERRAGRDRRAASRGQSDRRQLAAAFEESTHQ